MKIRKGNTEAEILLRGGYLYSFKVNNKDVVLRGNLYRPTRGGMAILIPYANRVKGGEYEFDGIKYYLPKNKEGNAIHGLILDAVFDVVDRNEDSLTLQYLLKHDGYPSELLCKVNYKVDENELSVTISVTNIGERRAPITVGAHPYFIVSDDWRISASTEIKQCVMKDKIPTGVLIDSKFEHRDYDDCFLVKGDIRITSSYSSILITRENMPFVQLYTGIKGALAVEPMSGAPDAYHNGLGLKVLNSKEDAHFSFKIVVEKI